MSQTTRNPSIISFFIALANKRGSEHIDLEAFGQLWTSRIMTKHKHERFRCRVSESDPKYFEVIDKPFDEYVEELPHPQHPDEFKSRISNFLSSPIDVNNQLWEATLSTGPLYSSGAISRSNYVVDQDYESETVALFRSHHVLCDGVSLSAVIADVSDEGEKLNQMILDAVGKHKLHAKKIGFFHSATSLVIGVLVYWVFGSIVALSAQFLNMMVSSNPFDEFAVVESHENDTNPRSVAWKKLTTVQEAKSVVRSLSIYVKLNDLFVTLLGRALERQYSELKANGGDDVKCPSTINIVVPVHLTGGVILPHQSIGNKIGAFVAPIPFNPNEEKDSISSLRQITTILHKIKMTPAPQISWLVTALISTCAPKSVAKYAMVRANCHAAAVISNVRAFPFKIHWMERPVEMICAFLPLPPGIPIGLIVTSYDGEIIFSIDADKRIVPDADTFLQYMADEYEVLKHEATKGEVTGAESSESSFS
eukprot:scaffold15803_cov179-Alexandrium_tamarense.AAC.1